MSKYFLPLMFVKIVYWLTKAVSPAGVMANLAVVTRFVSSLQINLTSMSVRWASALPTSNSLIGEEIRASLLISDAKSVCVAAPQAANRKTKTKKKTNKQPTPKKKQHKHTRTKTNALLA